MEKKKPSLRRIQNRLLHNLTTARASACLDYIEQLVIELKRRLKDPYILVSGDFNQWKPEIALQEFRDMSETRAGPTRGDRTIDRTFSNLDSITKASTLSPLQTEESDGPVRESDHRVFLPDSTAAKKR